MAGVDCVTEADLRALLVGDLPEPVAKVITRHLENCAACEAAARQLDALTDPFLRSMRRALHGNSGNASTAQSLPQGRDEGTKTETGTAPSPLPPTRGRGEGEGAVRLSDLVGYAVLEELGRGGMSVVYRARQSRPERVVALKVLLSGRHASTERRLRFLAEADAIARLQHPGIVQVYEVGEHEGLPFLVLEFMGGGSLAQKLIGRPLPPRQAALLAETLARAVEHAHRHGVIHRDLKPANVLLTEEERPKISDFGLAKQERPDLTATGEVLGTPSYMAPEQAQGAMHQVGPAADIYALGAMLYEFLTGRPPFVGVSVLETLEQVRSREPVPPGRLSAGTPRDLETICLKCLEKEQARRYPSAGALADDLRRFHEGRPIHARPAGPAERLLKWARRRPAPAALLGTIVLAVLALAVGGLWERQQRREARAAALVQALATAEPLAVPALINDLEEYRPWAKSLLVDRLDKEAADTRPWVHLRLALLPEDPGQRDVLAEYLLRAQPDELRVVRDLLAPHHAELAEVFWRVLSDPQAEAGRRFRAACVLAAYAPDHPRWPGVSAAVVQHLVRENSLVVSHWVEALRPVRAALVPALVTIFRGRDSREAERLLVANLLADYAGDQPELLTERLLEADAESYAVLLPQVLPNREVAVPLLKRELARTPKLHWLVSSCLAPLRALGGLRTESPEAREAALAGRQANAVITLAHLGQPEELWQRLRQQPDPTLRSYLVDRMAAFRMEPRTLVERLAAETNVSARRALLLALGEYDFEKLPAGGRPELVQQFLEQYRREPDPGLHGALEWVLRQRWGQSQAMTRIDAELRGQPWHDRLWFVNSQGQTFTIIKGPVNFSMGSPDREEDHEPDEVTHPETIKYSFAIANKEVTVDQFIRSSRRRTFVRKFSPTGDCPMNSVSWYDAVAYCNWLSEREGFARDQWCYEPNEKGEYDEGMKLAADYWQRTGYRLPTEAEWEYACRAGTISSHFYGSPMELLPRYAHSLMTSKNRAWPVGQLKPNDLGLFDMYGNVAEWCQELHAPYFPDPKQKPRNIREVRGLCSRDAPELFRSARRNGCEPDVDGGDTGVRPARTMR